VDDLVQIAGYPSLDVANATVEDLLLHGIGATVGGPYEPGATGFGVDASVGLDPAEQPYSVLVVATDRLRAREILGLVDDREQELVAVERARTSAPSLRILVPVVLVAFILIPVAAFYLSFKASGG
jgi:hypothetical protein